MTPSTPFENPAAAAPLPIVIVGHVDHGKSTLIGRLLHDTGSLAHGRYEQILRASKERGMPFEWSFLMDALQAERNQGVTIDSSRIGFKTAKRSYVIIDAPGHREFLKNMISGASASEAALLMVDAKEGVKEQTRRHGYLLHLLGVRQLAVVVSKMDMVDFAEYRFDALEQEIRLYLAGLGLTPVSVIPVCARDGDNLTALSARMPWYGGPCVLEALDSFEGATPLHDAPLRLPVQDIYKFDERRIIAGRIESGSLSVGDELLFSPTGSRARVASIEEWNAAEQPLTATAGMCVGITLDESVFVERGHVASHMALPPVLTTSLRARVFWLGEKPLVEGNRYRLRINTQEVMAEVKVIERVIDTDTLSPITAHQVPHGSVAEIVLRTRGMIAVDAFRDYPHTGRFVMVENYDICGGGIIDLDGFPDQRVSVGEVKSHNLTHVDLKITARQRALANGHCGGILWFTGFSGSGKSTLAVELQRQLFAKGYHVCVLDGDNVREGLNKDLGFSPEDRSENIRRVGEVAALFAQAGMIVITAFISPYIEDRRRAQAAAPEAFHLIHIKASLETCEKRDAKGLYKKARRGEITDFTGISAPYEEPSNPDLVIDTAELSLQECVALLMDYVKKEFVETLGDGAL